MSWKTFSTPIRTGHGVQTNAPELRSGPSQDFASPKPSNVKAKVIHKEKLSTLQQNFMLGVNASRAETVPTAHVSPHMTTNHHHLPPASPLRRAVSTAALSPAQRNLENLLQKASSNEKRWSSYQNLCADNTLLTHDDFYEIGADTDPTLNESGFRDSEEMHAYKVQSQLTQPGCGPTRSVKQNPEGSAAMQFLPVGKDMMGHQRLAEGLRSHIYATDQYPSQPPGGGPNNTYGSMQLQSKLHYAGGSATGYNLPTAALSQQGSGIFSGSDMYSQPARDNFSSDLTSWQQRHQEQLRRQHYEATQPSSMYDTGSSGPIPAGLTVPSLLDPHKLDAVKRAADSIIREKDTIIEKQKLKLVQLERQTVKESEVDLHKALLQKAHQDGDALSFKLQEIQYENAALKAQLTEVASNKDQIEKKLGEAEYGLRELRLVADRERSSKKDEQMALQEKVSVQEEEWREKCEELESERARLKQRVESMERYLHDLPTADDHAKRIAELRNLKEDKAKYKARAVELDRRLAEANKAIKQRQEAIDKLKKTESDTKKQIDKLQAENAHLRGERGLEGTDDLTLVPEGELEEVKQENTHLQTNLEKAKKLLETKHKKHQAMEVRLRGELKQQEDRLSQEEAAVTALREEVSNKDALLKKLRASVKELGRQNQDLLERNVLLESHQRELEQQLTGESRKLEQRLMKEMAVCFNELQSLVEVCMQQAEGHAPNISVLLGVKANTTMTSDESQPVGDNLQSIKYKLAKLTELRQDIDKLREILSNKYADEMAADLNCTTQ